MGDEPVRRARARGLLGAYFSRIAINPGISFSAIEISFRPKSANEMSATLQSCFVFSFGVVVLIKFSQIDFFRRFRRFAQILREIQDEPLMFETGRSEIQ